MNITKILPIAAALILTAPGARALELQLTPGTLISKMPQAHAGSDPLLKLTGSADVTDLEQLRNLPAHVTRLDMSGLTIKPYTFTEGSYMGRTSYAAGQLPMALITGSNVTEIQLPANTSIIDDKALALTKIKSITIPATVTKVGEYAFASCRELRTVVVEGNPTFGRGAFRSCPQLSVFKTSATQWKAADEMFYGDAAMTAIPQGVNEIGDKAFEKSSLSSVSLMGIHHVGDYALANIPTLATIDMDGNTTFGKAAFLGDTGLESLPEWNASVSELMFLNTDVKLPAIVHAPVIEEGAFANNKNIQTIRLGSEVSDIRANAFRNATSLKTIEAQSLGDRTPEVSEQSFAGLLNSEGRYDITLYVEPKKTQKWTEHPVWSLFDVREGDMSSTMSTPQAYISVSREGNSVTVRSDNPLKRVTICSTSGEILYDGGTEQQTLTVDVPAEQVLIVRVTSGATCRVVKLL